MGQSIIHDCPDSHEACSHPPYLDTLDFGPEFYTRLQSRLDSAVDQINQEYRPMLKTQGLAQKLKLLHHNLNEQADQLGKRVDDASNKSTETFAKSHKFLDTANSDMDEVDKFIAELNAATNGAP